MLLAGRIGATGFPTRACIGIRADTSADSQAFSLVILHFIKYLCASLNSKTMEVEVPELALGQLAAVEVRFAVGAWRIARQM